MEPFDISCYQTAPFDEYLKAHREYCRKLFDLNNYIVDGFQKICRVKNIHTTKWEYTDINREMMYDPHCSWVYFITVNRYIVKVGESNNPLGIEMVRTNQPVANSTCRLGRYRSGDGTDKFIRDELADCLRNGDEVCFWAKSAIS